MIEPQAAQLDVQDPPRIALKSLRELQRLLGVFETMWAASQPGDGAGAADETSGSAA
jgi:hypothetical protein